jgi:hypothetical protein
MRAHDLDQAISDAWTPLSFKRQFGSRRRSVGAGHGFHVPDWVGPENGRRMMAYAILRSYLDNAAREFMITESRDRIDDRREYGDAAMLVATVVGALLGEDPQIITQGAEEMALEEGPDGPGGTTVDDPEARAEAEVALAMQDWLREWAKSERLVAKIQENEALAVGIGDSVYTLGWSPDKERARIRIWDPQFYFPVLGDGNEDDFPSRVHVGYELVDPELKDHQTKIRRITWELGPIGNAVDLPQGTELLDIESLDADGGITRLYPWNTKPSRLTCYMTDATWTLDQAKTIEDLTGSTAVYAEDADGPINRRDLQIDFIPVVHVPNTLAQLDHFGRSLLSSVLQILDDIASADTDLAASSATTGHPVIALQGGVVEKDSQGRAKLTYEPGEILESGDGKLDVLDTSKALSALIELIEFLLKRMSVNSRVAEALQGRVKASEVPSGVALALSFGPTDQLVKSMRLVRSEKYPLILKFAHRISLAAKAAGVDIDVPDEWVDSDFVPGSFLPQDQQAAVDQVTKLYQAKAISLETAITMLMEAGIPIQRVLEEVRRIQERDFQGAADLFDAIGEKGPVYDYLGLEEPPEPDPVPVIVDPSAVPIPGQQPPNPGADPTLFGPDGQPLA